MKRMTLTLLVDASGTNTNLAPAGSPARAAPDGVATIAWPADLAAPWQFVSCHGGLLPGAASMRQMPCTASGCHQWPPGATFGVELSSQTPPRGVVRAFSSMTPSV